MSEVARVFALIPARGGSKRLPRKNVHPIHGVPLIAYTIRAALAAVSVDRVAVSTEDAEIAEVARAWGAEVIHRPAELAQDTSPIDDTLRHGLDACRTAGGAVAEILVWLQADVPIRRAGLIDCAVEMLWTDARISAVATGFRVTQHPLVMKELDAEGYLRPVELDVGAYRMQDLPPRFLLDGAIVAIRSQNFERYREAGVHLYLGSHPKLLVQEHSMYSLNVETPEDVELAAFYLERFSQHRVARREVEAAP